MATHRHRAVKETERPFAYGLWPDCRNPNPAAHGCIEKMEHCSCGATRKWNINGSHIERGNWVRPE